MPALTPSFWPRWQEQKGFALLLGILLSYGIVFLGTEIKGSLLENQLIGVGDRLPPTIVVEATGEATSTAKLAKLAVGVSRSGTTSAEATANTATIINPLIAAFKAVGLTTADIKTASFNVYPQYDYEATPPAIIGYEATQSLILTIRQDEWGPKIVDTAGTLGATNIGSLTFEATDKEVAQAEARVVAIAKASAQAVAIAKTLGVNLGSVVSYSEYEYSTDYPVYARFESNTATAELPAGEEEVSLTVHLEFNFR